jgi:hypothetical protein
MIHPVTVTNSKGMVVRVITSEELEDRSHEICQAGDGHFVSYQIREGKCERQVCQKPFWTRQRGKRYCSRDCSGVIQKETAKATKVRHKEKLRMKKEGI